MLTSLAKSPEILYGKYQRFREALADATGLDEAFPYDWININSFEAKLCAMGTWGATPGRSFVQLRHVFERESRKLEQGSFAIFERNTEIMAAAQWIIWHGQTMFSFIIYDEDIEDAHMCAVGDIGDAAPLQPRSVERWRYWTRKFEEVEAWPEATDECKGLAARAARLMHVLEENMVFSV